MHPGVADLADAGELDSVFRVEGHWIRADGIPPNAAFWDHATAGAAGDLLGHVLSVVRVGVKSRPTSVTAFMWNRYGRATHGDAFAGHDTLEALVAFEGGETAHLVVAWAANQPAAESIGVTFHGSEASLDVPLMGRELDVERFRPTLYRRGEDPRTLDGLPVQTEDTFVLQGRNWVEAARGNEPVRFPAEDALDVQAVLDAAIASASQQGRPVEPQL
jgi:predicted dehydrogenase